ncbi:hypothetical protein FRB97_005607 [Tulasnella sp. 331]|nr:hypothetical protein FRB97_005607 [Tulasnella sp. 331]
MAHNAAPHPIIKPQPHPAPVPHIAPHIFSHVGPQLHPTYIPPMPQPKPVPMSIAMPAAFDSAPQRAQVIAGVKASIVNINEIIDLLNKPCQAKSDLIDMDYPPEIVTTFKVRCTEAENNLTMASTTASAWFTAVGNHLQEITNVISELQAEMKTLDEDIAKNMALIEANVKAVHDLQDEMSKEKGILAKAQADYQEAMKRYNSAKAEKNRVETARNCLCWMPLVAICLSVVDITKEQNDVNSRSSVVNADSVQMKKDVTLLSTHAAQLKTQQQDGITLHATLTGDQTKETELTAQKTKLNGDAEYLGPLKINIDHCIHAVSGALGSAENIDNMMSMKNVGDGIKGLVAALKNDSDFSGTLATLDEKGFADLDKKIIAMQKSSKKAIKLAV